MCFFWFFFLNPGVSIILFQCDSPDVHWWWQKTHTDLINTAEQSLGGLILLWRASCLNRLQKTLWRQCHHPVQQTQQEGYDQLEHTRTQMHTQTQGHWAKRVAAVRRWERVWVRARYPLILFVRRRLGGGKQVCDGGDQNLGKLIIWQMSLFFPVVKTTAASIRCRLNSAEKKGLGRFVHHNSKLI